MTDQLVTSGRKRRPEARPAEIIDAALDLFVERGFSATRLDDVASRAGLSKGAIYLYFKDKTSLLKAVVESTVGANIAYAAGLANQHQGPLAPLLKQILITVAGRVRETRLPDVMKLVISESRAHPEIGRYYLENVIGKALPLFQSLVEKGIASGEFRPVNARHAVMSLVSPMLLSSLWKTVFEPLGAEPLDIEALANQHADFILRAIKP